MSDQTNPVPAGPTADQRPDLAETLARLEAMALHPAGRQRRPELRLVRAA